MMQTDMCEIRCETLRRKFIFFLCLIVFRKIIRIFTFENQDNVKTALKYILDVLIKAEGHKDPGGSRATRPAHILFRLDPKGNARILR